MTQPDQPKPRLPRLLSGAVCVAAVVGSLLTLALPSQRTVDERALAVDAMAWLTEVHAAQGAWHSSHKRYQWDLQALPAMPDPPAGFRVAGPRSTDWNQRWEVRLSRVGSAQGGWSLVWDQDGYDAFRSSLPEEYAPGA